LIEKSLIIIITIYAISFSALGFQYVIGDLFGFTITNYRGEEIKSDILDWIDESYLNQLSQNVVTANFTENETAFNKVIDSTIAAAYVGWELVQLITGTYVYNHHYHLGVPPIFIAGMVILYVFLLGRTIIGYIRGI